MSNIIEKFKQYLKMTSEDTQMAESTLESGEVVVYDSLENGVAINVLVDDQQLPLPVGEYLIEGINVVIVEEGIITIPEIADETEEEEDLTQPAKEDETEVEFTADFEVEDEEDFTQPAKEDLTQPVDTVDTAEEVTLSLVEENDLRFKTLEDKVNEYAFLLNQILENLKSKDEHISHNETSVTDLEAFVKTELELVDKSINQPTDKSNFTENKTGLSFSERVAKFSN